MPIIEPYFLENSPNRVALAEQALNLFTAILKRVPWNRYVKILLKYIQQINTEERTKQAVRYLSFCYLNLFCFYSVLMATLDGFHFDLRALDQPLILNNCNITNTSNAENLIDKSEQKQIEMTEQYKKKQIFAFVYEKLLPKLKELLRPKVN